MRVLDTLINSPPGFIIRYQHFFRRALYVLRQIYSCAGVVTSITGDSGSFRSRSCAFLPLFRLVPIFDRLAQLELLVCYVSPSGLLKEPKEIEEEMVLRFL